MAEYIEREKAWRKVNRAKNIEEALSLIDSIPSADVAEVVRCKDCKYFVTNGIEPSFCEYHTDNVGYCDEACWVDENDFCSYGAKMDGEVE